MTLGSNRSCRGVAAGVALAACLAVAAGLHAAEETGRWESAIAAFEAADRRSPPAPGAVLFTGSSSVVGWKSLAEDMRPLPVLNRGFGGSHISDVNQYLARIVLPHRPRAVVLYAGDNDLSGGTGKTPESVLEDFRSFVSRIHAELPGTPIYFLAIKPSIARFAQWPVMRRANERIADFAQETPGVTYVDVATPMLDASARPRRELFVSDGLHLDGEGYALWTSIVKPVLVDDLARPGAESPAR